MVVTARSIGLGRNDHLYSYTYTTYCVTSSLLPFVNAVVKVNTRQLFATVHVSEHVL